MSLRLMLPYASPRFPQWHQAGELVDCTDDPLRYSEMFFDMWATEDDFVVIEHDIIIGMNELYTLVSCGELATVPYYLHPQRTMHRGPILSVYSDSRLHTDRTADRCQRSGLGCTYFPHTAPCRQYPLPESCPEGAGGPNAPRAPITWGNVDTWVCDHIEATTPDLYPWRVLWLPIDHLPCLPGVGPETVDSPFHTDRWVKIST